MSDSEDLPFDVEYVRLLGESIGLSPAECDDLHARMRRGEAAALEEIRAAEAAVERLAEPCEEAEGEEITAPPLGEGLLERIASSEPAPDPIALIAESEGKWAPTGIPGVEFRLLGSDPELGRKWQLLKIGPDTTFPAHDHPGGEELLILEGDLWSEGVELKAGDSQMHAVGSHHHELSSRTGCIALVTTGGF